MKISVIGCGRLGAPYAAGMAEMGHQVLGLDTSPATIRTLRAGRAPFDEPGLHEIIACHTRTGRLRFTDSYEELVNFADLHFLCVGTPQRAGSLAIDLTDLERATTEVAHRLRRPSVLVIKSSVPVGTTARLTELARSLVPAKVEVRLACSPDFLRESTSLADIRRPSRIILGVEPGDGRTEKLLRDAWKPQLEAGTPMVVTDLATAELAKTAANALLATKVSFTNAMAALCEAGGGNMTTLARTLALDSRVGDYGLAPGLGYGGSCLPKDVRGLIARAEELGIGQDLRLLTEVDAVNRARRKRLIELAKRACGGHLGGKPIAVWGLSFKPGIDDIRDSPALAVALEIKREGALVTAYDPMAMPISRIHHPELAYAPKPVDAVIGAHLLLHLTAWPEFAEIDPAAIREVAQGARLIDAPATLPGDVWTDAGWDYQALGRKNR
jgi:UDPglucose 6-dehydrogenase